MGVISSDAESEVEVVVKTTRRSRNSGPTKSMKDISDSELDGESVASEAGYEDQSEDEYNVDDDDSDFEAKPKVKKATAKKASKAKAVKHTEDSMITVLDDDSDLDDTGFVPVLPPKRITPKKSASSIDLDMDENDDDESKTGTIKPDGTADAEPKKPKGRPKANTRMLATMPVKMSAKLIPAVIFEPSDEVDLDGDTGAVGRFFAPSAEDNMFRLDLKGYTFQGLPRPCATFMVMKVSNGEAKVESLIDTYLDLECIDSVYNATEVLNGNIDDDEGDDMDDEIASDYEMNGNGKRPGDGKSSKKTSKKIKVLASDDVAPTVGKAGKAKPKAKPKAKAKPKKVVKKPTAPKK
ncbi:hypothetical protein SARC_02920 [Sphaeroforma arctica JP610]|uniref:Uncharacterized protein n=1 Tax=Sphaeroforma arctica JP610 TaxID=667725 RepID=A0A0L0G7M3_9EUKA|nr:hypothetical protein SARC_02920 [Sphaeroforma arctica JP610]KNC84881.1 hypothetical protein SARC_02920 [Sphaeroforma arctica JP610]|eukprot:XP_014158783.1 hypothetical protein SARC_02920 [Sphaeroforma arctica JP610]